MYIGLLCLLIPLSKLLSYLYKHTILHYQLQNVRIQVFYLRVHLLMKHLFYLVYSFHFLYMRSDYFSLIFFLAFFSLIIISLRKHWDFVIPLSVYFIFCSLYEFDPVTRPTYNVIVFFLPLLIYPTTANKFHDFILSCQKTKSLIK